MEVLFFPRKDIDVKICDYRYGKRFAIQSNSDGAQNPSVPFILFQNFKHSTKYTIFANRYKTGGVNSILDGDYTFNYNSGVVDIQHYFSTDRWVNPITGADEIIPDYYSATWTSAGASVFDVNVGDPKPTGFNSNGSAIVATRYPNHGEQMYNISNGNYGYDPINDVLGGSNLSEFIGIVENQDKWTDIINVPKSSTFSYRNGQNTNPQIYKLGYLAGRNSNINTNYFFGGISKDGNILGNDILLNRTNEVNQSITTRWIDSYKANPTTANNLVRTKIQQAYNNRGVYFDFSHHHQGTNQQLEDLYKTIGEYLDAQNIRSECWICGYGELSEYIWYRSLVKRAVATVVNNSVYVTLEWNDLKTEENGISDDILKDMLNTPLSIEIDLSDTPLAGKLIQNSGGSILSLGSNKYIVDVPFGNAIDGCRGVELKEGDGEYLPNNILTYSTSTVGGYLYVTTNNVTNAILFYHNISDDIYSIKTSEISINNTQHTFDISDSTKKYYVGVKDWKESTIIEITAL